MKYFAATAALVSVIPRILSMTINTPTSVVQCQPQLITWSDGMAPYYLTIIPGGQPSAAPLKSFDTQSGNSVTWVVDIAGGTSVTFALKDSTGATAYTDMVTILSGPDSSCLNGSQNSAGPTTKAADTAATSAAAAGSSASGSASHAGNTAASSVGAITRSTTIGGQPTQSVSRAASASAGSPAATTGTSGTTSGTTSGAQTKYSFGGYVVVGALGLLGAAFL